MVTNHNVEEKQTVQVLHTSDSGSGDEKVVYAHHEETAHAAAERGHLATDE